MFVQASNGYCYKDPIWYFSDGLIGIDEMDGFYISILIRPKTTLNSAKRTMRERLKQLGFKAKLKDIPIIIQQELVGVNLSNCYKIGIEVKDKTPCPNESQGVTDMPGINSQYIMWEMTVSTKEVWELWHNDFDNNLIFRFLMNNQLILVEHMAEAKKSARKMILKQYPLMRNGSLATVVTTYGDKLKVKRC